MSYVHALVWAFRHATGQYAVPEADVILRLLPNDAVCFDVGAHGGLWTRALARGLPRGKVYAFEALPYYAKVLERTLALIGPKNVSLLNAAVSDQGGTVSMVDKTPTGTKLTGRSHVAGQPDDISGAVEVQAVTLDDFWRGHGNPTVSFVKCDVEGFELAVLRGAQSLIEGCTPLFYNELNREWCERYGYQPKDVFDFFAARGYGPYYITDTYRLEAADPATHVNRDVLFVPNRLLSEIRGLTV